MCQYFNTWQVAKEDIEFYKVVEMSKENGIISPYMGLVLNFGLNVAKPQVWSNKAKGTNPKTVGDGYFHCFKDIRDAKSYFSFSKDAIIVKGIIPKGTVYYEGKTEMGFGVSYLADSYAAEKIYIKEFVG